MFTAGLDIFLAEHSCPFVVPLLPYSHAALAVQLQSSCSLERGVAVMFGRPGILIGGSLKPACFEMIFLNVVTLLYAMHG